MALRAAQQSASAVISTLSSSANTDGGWSNASGYATDALDTAQALTALCGAHASSSVIGAGAAELQSLQLTDGGFGLTSFDDLYVSLWSLRAFDACAQQVQVTSSATPLKTWVLAQRNASNEFADVEFNALGLLALIGQINESAVLAPLVDALHAAQAGDGSWSEDPYLTALAVEALNAYSNIPPPPTTGGINGAVTDDTGTGLIGATVLLVEAPQFATSSASAGAFSFSGVAPGTYTVKAQAPGYSSAQRTATVTAGKIVSVGNLVLTAAPLTTTLSGRVQNSAGAAIANAMVAVGTAYVTTDATGNYTLSGLPAGSATIVVSASGYQSATATATFAAGTSYEFSPTLYSTTPPATSVTGRVIDSSTSIPIVNAQVASGTQSTFSAADGTFTLTGVSSGSFSMSVTKSGYTTATVTGILGAGANNVGTIPMGIARTTSSISGVITDAGSGSPITGAVVAIQGTALVATTDSSGHYSISSISPLNFVVTFNAAGYLTQQTSVQLNTPGDATLNGALVPAGSSNVSFTSVTMSAAQYLPNDGLDVHVTANNSGNTAVDLVVQADILDSQNNVVATLLANPVGIPGAVTNNPVSLAASSNTNLTLAYRLQHQAAGNYSVQVRGFSTAGQVLAEGSTSFAVQAIALFGGAVDADPPLLSAGTNTPVHVTAKAGDMGNLPIPVGNASVTVTLESVDGSYNPADQGNLKLRATDPLFQTSIDAFADPDGSIYTYSQTTDEIIKTTPSGQVSVAVNLAQYGIGWVRDLARDSNGTWWLTLGGSRVANITSNGVYSEFNLKTTSVLSLTVDSAGNQYYLDSDHIVKRDPLGNESTIWSGGLANPVGLARNPDGSFVVSNSYYGSGFLMHMGTDGRLTGFAGGLNYPKGVALGPDGNYYVADSGQNAVIKVTPAGATSVYASGLHSPYGIAFDSHGQMIVADQGADAILRINADGTNTVMARSIMSGAYAMAYGPDSSLYVTQSNGVVRRTDPQGQITDLATGISAGYGIAVDANNVAYITSYNAGVIKRVSNFGSQDFATGLATPGGIAIDPTHQYLAVEEHDANRLRWYDMSGNELGRVDSVLRSPWNGALDSSGNLYVVNDTFVSRFSGSSVPTIYASNVATTVVAYNSVDGQIYGKVAGNLVTIAAGGTTTLVGTPPANSIGLAIDDQGRPIVADSGATNLYRADATGTFALLTALPAGETLTALTSSPTGAVYFATNQKRLYRVGDDASITSLATWTADIRSLSVGLDGNIGLLSVGGWATVVNATSGTIAPAFSTPCGSCNVARDGAGDLILIDQGQALFYTYDVSGTLLSKTDGFTSPGAFVWTGSDFRFWDQRGKLFSWTPGSYPARLKPDAEACQGSMTWANGALYALSLCSYPGALYKWDSSGMSVWTMLPISAGIITTRPDGNIAVSDGNRLVVIDLNGHIVQDLSGVVHPSGIAFDAQDHLYVASDRENVVLRFDDIANPFPTTFARANWVSDLAVKSDGSLYATGLNFLYNIDTQGGATTLATVGNTAGVAVAANGDAIAVNSGYSIIDRWNGSSLTGFAAGLWGANLVRAAPDGSLYLANNYNGALTHYANGGISIVNAPISGPASIGIAADGTVFYGGRSYGGIFAEVRPDGTTSTLNIPQLLENANVTGIVSLGPNHLGLVTQGQNVGCCTYVSSIYDVTITPPPALPPAGAVVYQSSQALPSIAPLDSPVSVDFGSFTPTLPGDYRIEVTHSQATGNTVNRLHVGPAAQGSLTSSLTNVSPGDAQVPVTLNVSGADFESVAKIDASQIRPVATVPSPGSFALDAAGNVYYGDGNGLNRVALPGTPTLLVGGYNNILGITPDLQNGILFVGHNVAANDYELVRFDPAAATTTTLYTSATQIFGLAVNSAGDAYISIGNNLIRVRPDGSNSMVLDTGLYNSTTLTFDEADDLFIETSDHLINELKPDMTLHGVFASANGTTTPYFLNDEWGDKGIGGGCGHNIFISPSSWTAVGPGTEEHLLVQVLPDSGKAGLVFDGALFGLNDMDAVVTDRFHNHVLVWDDEDYLVTEIPVTCGAISVEAHVLSRSGQQLGNFSHLADAVIAQPDGRTDYVFLLQNVPTSGMQVRFDAPLSGLTLGQNIAVLDSAYLLFKNTFTNQDIRVPLQVPSVQVGNALNLSVSTDQPQYEANGNAQISAVVVNPVGQGPMSGTVQVDVLDASNALVAHIATQDVSLAPSGGASVPGTFAIGTVIPGTYIVRATMTNTGVTLAQATTTFIVNVDQGNGEITSTLAVDKLSYDPTDNAQLISHVSDISANAIVSNLTLLVNVTDVANHVLYTQTYPIAQILPKQTLAFTSEYAFANLSAGTYEVEQTVKDADNTLLSSASTSLVVSANTQQGLTGHITVSPLPARTDQPLTCQANLQNQATAAAKSLPLRVALINLGTSAVSPLSQTTIDIAGGGQWQTTTNMAAKQLAPGDYACSLQLQTSGTWQTLAYWSFTMHAVVDLQTSLSAPLTAIKPSQIAYFHLLVNNAGPDATSDSTFSITLPPQMQWIEFAQPAPTCTTNGQQISCELPQLPLGGSADLCFATRAVNANATPLFTQATAATNAGTTIEKNPANNSASLTIYLAPDLVYGNGFDPYPCSFAIY